MYNSLSLGPVTLPTAPLLAILAALLCLEVAARAGRHFGLRPDDLWNTGMIALLAGLIVARLWNVIQLRDIYAADPWLILSPRPSGFVLLPGIGAALIAGYVNLMRKAIDPMRAAASFALGLAAADVVLEISHYLTGAVVGVPSVGPLAQRYFFETVSPVGLYRAAGMTLVALIGWFTLDARRPARTLWLMVLGYSLTLLLTEPLVRDPALFGMLRGWQALALGLALAASLALASESRRWALRAAAPTESAPGSAPPVPTESS